MSDTVKVDYEKDKIDIEREKLALERYKAELQARQTRWTTVSVAIPIVVAFSTAGYSFYSSEQTSRAQFQLEAAKSAMLAGTSKEAVDRLTFYKKLFPNQLSETFVKLKIPEDEIGGTDQNEVKSKIELFKALASSKDATSKDLIAAWKAIFPDSEELTDRLKAAWLQTSQPAKP